MSSTLVQGHVTSSTHVHDCDNKHATKTSTYGGVWCAARISKHQGRPWVIAHEVTTHRPAHPAFTCTYCYRTHIYPCLHLLQYSLHPTTRTFVDRTVQAHVSAVMFAQPTAGPPILASKLTACPAFAEADHHCRANLFTPELLVISKSGCQHKVETSAALTNLDVVYVVRTTLMTHVTPEGRSRRGFPCSVTSPKSSSNATHAWRAVGRAGGLGLLQNESGQR
ncbi:hypothetical protein EDB83DRAFT_1090864 [Lactarius deliciosus]|nr:hypothetical protein EDB83DRAFT_1090864 [Lactarius deliciosus]